MEQNSINVLDHGFVRLDDSMASDLSVVNSARVSFGKRSQLHDPDCPMTNPVGAVCICDTSQWAVEDNSHRIALSGADRGLIGYLMKNRHGTPFEHNAFRFHVKAPIFIFREWQRHRIGSFNEMSARYMELPAEWYIPKPEDVRTRVGKPGHYTFESLPIDAAKQFIQELSEKCEQSYDGYRYWLGHGVAPEQARLFLHVNHYSEMYWTVNARSLMNFLSLRNSPTAQQEIREYAKIVEQLFLEKMPITASLFIENGRVAP